MGNQLENSIVKVVSNFHPMGIKGVNLSEDAHAIALSQQLTDDDVIEGGIYGTLMKIVMIRKPERRYPEESGVDMGLGYLLIT